MTKKHVLLLCDHDAIPSGLNLEIYDVTWITKEVCEQKSPSGIGRTFTLRIPFSYDIDEYMHHFEEIKNLTDQSILAAGPIWRVVAPMEQTILPGAHLRAIFAVPGMQIATAQRLRDKLLMKQTLAKTTTSVDLPQFGLLNEMESFTRFPVVVKPRSQAGSRGIVIVRTAKELSFCIAQLSEDSRYLLEEFIARPIIHIDGLVRHGKLIFVTASRYLHTCLEWVTVKKPMASSFIDTPELKYTIVTFTEHVIAALEISDNVFHMEAFLASNQSLTFLEIAGRPGGAGIAQSIKDRYGVDLVAESLNCDLQLPHGCMHNGFLDQRDCHDSGGWIVMPFPSTEPCVVRKIFGLEFIPNSVWHSEVPWIGKAYNQDYDEGLPSGKFFLHGASIENVFQDFEKITHTYRVEVENTRLDPISHFPST